MKKPQLKNWQGAFGLLGAMVISASSVQANTSEAQRFVCDHSGEVREVAVLFGPDKQLPCKVMYKKQGKEKTLWRARYDKKFCGVRAQELVAELEGGGWSCALSEPMPVADQAQGAEKAENKKAAENEVAEAKAMAPTTPLKASAEKAETKKAKMAQTPKVDPAMPKTENAPE